MWAVKESLELVPLAEMRSRFYSPYFIVPKKSCGLRPILDLSSINCAQNAVQEADAEKHFSMHPSPRLVCKHRPEERILSCLDSTQHRPFQGAGITVQPFRAVHILAPFRQQAYNSSISANTLQPQRLNAQAPCSFRSSGQLGEEQALTRREKLFWVWNWTLN